MRKKRLAAGARQQLEYSSSTVMTTISVKDFFLGSNLSPSEKMSWKCTIEYLWSVQQAKMLLTSSLLGLFLTGLYNSSGNQEEYRL